MPVMIESIHRRIVPPVEKANDVSQQVACGEDRIDGFCMCCGHEAASRGMIALAWPKGCTHVLGALATTRQLLF